MTETYTELSTTFSTADTVDSVSIQYRDGSLTVRFAACGAAMSEIAFSDVRAFTWTGWDDTSPEISPDRVYEVVGSALLAPWLRFSVGTRPFRHFKLGFNAEGKYLDVIATAMDARDDAGAHEQAPR